MGDNDQNNSFASGFLVRDKSGKLKKIQNENLADVSDEPKSEAASQLPPAPEQKVAAPTAPVVLEPLRPVSSSPKASSFLDPEDEKEIEDHKKELKKIIGDSTVQQAPIAQMVTIDSIVEEAKKKADFDFSSDPIMEKRFAKIVESRLRDIRDSIETKEVLLRPRKIGGLALSPEAVGSVIALVEAKYNLLDKAGLTGETEKKGEESGNLPSVFADKDMPLYASAPPPFVPRPGEKRPDLEPIVDFGKEEAPDKLAEQIKKELENLHKTPAVQPPQKPEAMAEKSAVPAVTPAVKAEAPVVLPEPPRKIISSQPSAEQSILTQKLYQKPAAAMARMQRPEPDRPQMIDIRQPQKVLGPIEEMEEIDLKEFRRLGSSPQESADKVFEKINLLEEDSWELKTEGIEAWKRSPVFSAYVKIGQESMKSNISVDEIIRKYQSQNQSTLLYEEFLAINELNKNIGV
ncbi:MAG: hypothetical protein WCV50_03845 [Patescibacteria group bacterium]|jgi:hypothetical protein